MSGAKKRDSQLWPAVMGIPNMLRSVASLSAEPMHLVASPDQETGNAVLCASEIEWAERSR